MISSCRKPGIHRAHPPWLYFRNTDVLSSFAVKLLMRLLKRVMNKTTINVFVFSDTGGGVALCPLLQGKIKLCLEAGLS